MIEAIRNQLLCMNGLASTAITLMTKKTATVLISLRSADVTLHDPEAFICFPFLCSYNVFFISNLPFRLRFIRIGICHDLTGPVIDPAELIDVGIPNHKQLLCRLPAAVPAAAVHQDDLIKVRKLFRLLRSDLFMSKRRNVVTIINMLFLIYSLLIGSVICGHPRDGFPGISVRIKTYSSAEERSSSK